MLKCITRLTSATQLIPVGHCLNGPHHNGYLPVTKFAERYTLNPQQILLGIECAQVSVIVA